MFNYVLDLVNSDEFDGLVRHGLTTVGGGLVANGVLTTTQWQTVSGAIVIVVGVIWSFASKRFIKAEAKKEVVNA